MEPKKKIKQITRITHKNEQAVYNSLRRFYILEIERALSKGWTYERLSKETGQNVEKIAKEGKFSPLRKVYLAIREALSKEPVSDGMNSKPRPGKHGDWIGK